jgi:hypothetical protein
MERVQELIFGYGNTRCLGILIAMMNLNKIFVEVCVILEAHIFDYTDSDMVCLLAFVDSRMDGWIHLHDLSLWGLPFFN